MTNQFIQFEQQGSVATLTLDRPEVMNAWHEAMREEVLAAINRARDDAAIAALVITGAGERAFSAGQDINESKEFDEDRAERLDRGVPDALWRAAVAGKAGCCGGQRGRRGLRIPVRPAERRARRPSGDDDGTARNQLPASPALPGLGSCARSWGCRGPSK